MATNVKLSDDLESGWRIAAVEQSSKQIEFYFKIAAIAEANPELSFTLIKEILKAMQRPRLAIISSVDGLEIIISGTTRKLYRELKKNEVARD